MVAGRQFPVSVLSDRTRQPCSKRGLTAATFFCFPAVGGEPPSGSAAVDGIASFIGAVRSHGFGMLGFPAVGSQ